jgi:RNA polymerase sigma-B factor
MVHQSRDPSETAAPRAEHAEVDSEALVVDHLWLAERCAAGYAGRGEHFDDLHQVAVIGLIKAARRFDPDRGVPFEAFAVPTIKGELRHHFRDHGWCVKVPEHIKEARAELRNAIARLEQQLGRAPRADEVASDMHVAADTLDDAVRADRAYEVESLDALGGRDGGSSEELLEDAGADVFGSAATRVDALESLLQLGARQRAIVYWRFFEDLPQHEIAERLGIGQPHVSRLLHASLRTIARRLGPSEQRSVRPHPVSPAGGA